MSDANKVLHDFKNLVQMRWKIEDNLKKVHEDFVIWSKIMDELFLDLGMQTKGGQDGYSEMVKGKEKLFNLRNWNTGSDSGVSFR